MARERPWMGFGLATVGVLIFGFALWFIAALLFSPTLSEWLARPWGGVQPLASDVVSALLEARHRAGLGPRARGLTTDGAPPLRSSAAVAAPAPAPARVERTGGPGTLDREALTRVIAEELNALLGRGG